MDEPFAKKKIPTIFIVSAVEITMLETLNDERLKPKRNGSMVPRFGEGAHLPCRTGFAV